MPDQPTAQPAASPYVGTPMPNGDGFAIHRKGEDWKESIAGVPCKGASGQDALDAFAKAAVIVKALNVCEGLDDPAHALKLVQQALIRAKHELVGRVHDPAVVRDIDAALAALGGKQ